MRAAGLQRLLANPRGPCYGFLFFAPYDSARRFADHPFAPPQRLRFIDQGRGSLRPFVYGYERFRDPESLRWRFNVDRSLRYPLSFFVRGDQYYVLGLLPTDLHLFGVDGEAAHLFLFGTDKLGRDLFSRNIRAARISLTIGLVGVTISFILGCILGGISGCCRARRTCAAWRWRRGCSSRACSSWPRCWPTTSSATACATPPTPTPEPRSNGADSGLTGQTTHAMLLVRHVSRPLTCGRENLR